jgi:hypothetical protein
MVDPYAPPRESANRPLRPAPGVEPYVPSNVTRTGASPGSQTYQQTYEAPPLHETPRDRDRPWRRDETHEPRTEPARPGLFWTVAAVGIGLLCLARLIVFFAVSNDLPDEQVAPAFFATLGVITLSAGLALAALLQRGLAIPWRIALILGSGYFAAVAGAVPLIGLAGLL